MPRIVPIQLLRCLKVLLNANGGILSRSEVERISTLMGKYSKKLVSKCIYVQILKCTDTELLDDFMRVNGWQLVFSWLFDGIRLTNWPLVQEILELLLLCPVDVNRLKLNSAPKTVKQLSLNGGTEGVRILAQRLVEQWLKIVTEGNEANQQAQSAAAAAAAAAAVSDAVQEAEGGKTAETASTSAPPPSAGVIKPEKIVKEEMEEADPLDVPDNTTNATAGNLTPTKAQKNASKSGLVYKIVVKDGQQLLTKIDPIQKDEIASDSVDAMDVDDDNSNEPETEMPTETLIEEDEEEEEEENAAAMDIGEAEEEDSTSLDKTEDKDGSESSSNEMIIKKSKERKMSNSSTDTHVSVKKTDKEQREHISKSNKETTKSKEHKSDKDKERKSSSSHRTSSSSSSSHKSSSKSSSSSSSSKSKSSSSSSSHRSSSDKHRSDKDRSSSSSKDKDKDRSSSSSSKHKSSSSSSSKSSSSSSSSSKERHRDKDKDKSSSNNSSTSSSSSSSSKKDKEREKEIQSEKDKDTLAKMLPPSIDKLGRIPKKPKDDKEDSSSSSSNSKQQSQQQPTSITIPSKKASISIEIRRDAEKVSAVKTYKSQFRSHGLTEEAPPPPSRKTLKKPNTTTPQSGAVIPTSLPSSLKRPSPPPKDLPTEKKQKIDVNAIAPAAAVAPEKPGAIKMIPPKRIQTLVETNLFSDALLAATGPKKVVKRKRSTTSANGKDEPTTPTSPGAQKVAPLKFYQDMLDESAKSTSDDKTTDKTKPATDDTQSSDSKNVENSTNDKDSSMIIDDDDDIPLNKVKEDIEQRVLKEKAADADAVEGTPKTIDVTSDVEDEAKTVEEVEEEVRKPPGPGCGPNGPPGVLMLHRRKGPKKKLTWRPQETLEQVRFFEMDENERVNVMKVSFSDMKNIERFNERTSLTMRRGPRPGDTQEPRTEWRGLIEVEDVPEHPLGNQSKERKVQADREMTTLRALYFSANMIPDSPSEAELELHSSVDPPAIPLDDITGNPDAVNDFSSMPWPEPKGSPRNNDSGTGGLSNAAADMFGALNAATIPPKPQPVMPPTATAFNNFMGPFGGGGGPPNNMPPGGPQPLQQMSPNSWQGPPQMQPGPIMPNPFQQNHPKPDMMMGPGPGPGPNFMGPQRGNAFNGPPFMGAGNPQYGPLGFGPNGPNFGPMGPPPGGPPMMNNMNNMGPVPLLNGPPRGGMGNNRNNQNWIHGPPNNFQDNNNGAWRPAGSGNNNNNNGVCKAFMRGNCRNGKNCKFIHPKSRR